MNEFETMLRNFSSSVCQDQLEERLRRASHDGTELFYLLDRIANPENASLIAEIKRALQKTYVGNFPLDVAIEIFGKWREDEGLS
jgi:hypothetical protein